MSFLCTREDWIRLSRGDFDPELRQSCDLSTTIVARVLPLSIVGLGKATLAKESLSVANIFLMDSESLGASHDVRCEVRGYTSGQGAEHAVSEVSVDVIPQRRGLYEPSDPNVLHVPEVLAGA